MNRFIRILVFAGSVLWIGELILVCVYFARTPLEILRVAWVNGTFLGTLLMLILLREVWLDHRATRTKRERIVTRAEIRDQAIRLVAIASLLAAGVLSYFMKSELVLSMFLISALAQIILAGVKLYSRGRLFNALRPKS